VAGRTPYIGAEGAALLAMCVGREIPGVGEISGNAVVARPM
jgi:hypothetical protein